MEFKWPPTAASASAIDGPGSSTDNAVVRWDGANGDTAQNSVVLIGDTGAVTGVTTLAASGAITGSNLSGTNTGDQTITLTGDVTGTGTGSFAASIGAGKVTNAMLATASSAANNSYIVLRNVVGNSNFNNVGINTTTTASAAQTVTMTYASTGNQRITGTSTVRFKLPDATYLTNGDQFYFNNNSTGTVSIYAADNTTLITTIPGGGRTDVLCTDNGTTNGTWDYHNLLANGSISGTTGTALVGTLTTDQIIDSGLTANTVPYANASKQLTSSAVTPTELGYVSGVTSAIQTQMNLKAPLASPTFTGTVTLPILVGSDTTDSSSSTTGAFTTAGGMGIAKKLYVGGNFTIGSTSGRNLVNHFDYTELKSSTTAKASSLFFESGATLNGGVGATGTTAADSWATGIANYTFLHGTTGIQFIGGTYPSDVTIGKVTAAGTWTLGASSGSGQHILQAASTSPIIFKNTGATNCHLTYQNSGGNLGFIGFDSSYNFNIYNNGGSTVIGTSTSAGAWTLGPTAGGALDHYFKGRSLTIDGVSAQDPGLYLQYSGSVYTYDELDHGNGYGFGVDSRVFNIRGNGGSVLSAGAFTPAGAWTLGASGLSGTHKINGITHMVPASDVTNTVYFGFRNVADSSTIGSITRGGASLIDFNTSSDERIKKNFTESSFGLSTILSVPVYEYDFISDDMHHNGFKAQDLHAAYPFAAKVGGEDPLQEPWMVDYSKVTPVLWKAIQEQQALILALEARLLQLES